MVDVLPLTSAPPPTGPPVWVDPRDRPRSSRLRNGGIIGGLLLATALLITAGAPSIDRAARCSGEFAMVSTAELRFRNDAGKFGDTTALVDGDFLDRTPKHFKVTVIDSKGRSVRIRGTGPCDFIDRTQDDKILGDS